ncbi:hypothetical protein V1227_06390 [Lentzea sp. DG1S-22]|uniref:hypothetical protein n=1 Tax=Lentzea sp. DG1S-22 TaxID=3108822 RepID=UPI002E79131C|nr:hypothetical protein [Lentzea sp. DG1S-22]WVH82381.1 hypothetical protein V1227_06390 [Lentzea sp. DG1S-22]
MTGNAVVLPLGRGLVAFDVPADRAVQVRDRMEHNGFSTPALLVGARGPRAVFLAETDEVVLGQFQMPGDVRFLTVPSTVELPLPNARATRGTAWFCPPDPRRRWLLSASTVLAAIDAATPPPMRTRQRQDHRQAA